MDFDITGTTVSLVLCKVEACEVLIHLTCLVKACEICDSMPDIIIVIYPTAGAKDLLN